MPGPFVYRWSVLLAAHRTALNSLPADAPHTPQNIYLDPITSPNASPVEASSTVTTDKKPVVPPRNYTVQTTAGLRGQEDVTAQPGKSQINMATQAAQHAHHEARPSTEIADAIRGYADVG